MIDKDKNLYATLIINSLNDAAARAAYRDVTKDEFVDLATNAYIIVNKQVNYDPEAHPFKPAPQKVEVKPKLNIKVGQVYSVDDYGVDKSLPGVCVITRVDTGVNLRWTQGAYAPECRGTNNGFDNAGLSFFERPAVKLLAERPDPAPGQIWKGREVDGAYYLLLKRCDKSNPEYTIDKGWEVKASNDLNNKFRWLNDINWNCKDHCFTFIGYKDDPLLDKIEGINS